MLVVEIYDCSRNVLNGVMETKMNVGMERVRKERITNEISE